MVQHLHVTLPETAHTEVFECFREENIDLQRLLTIATKYVSLDLLKQRTNSCLYIENINSTTNNNTDTTYHPNYNSNRIPPESFYHFELYCILYFLLQTSMPSVQLQLD